MHYWNNPDGDGQSLSDCASDIFDDDMKDISAPDPTPEKKKRPPRKKKKKQTVPLETAKEEDEKGDAGTTEHEDNNESKQQAESTTPEIKEHNEKTSSVDPKTSQLTPKLPQASMITATEMPSASVGNIKTASSLNPNAAAWSTVGAKPSNTSKPPISAMNNNTVPLARTPWATQPNVAKQQLTTKTAVAVGPETSARKNVVVDNYKPKPGTWASMAVKKDTTSNHPAAAQSISTPRQEFKPQIKHSTVSPDWRNHVVSPHRSPYKKTSGLIVGVKNINSIPAPPMSEPQQQAWPTLNDFGPPLGGEKEMPKITKPVGAWGSKPL